MNRYIAVDLGAESGRVILGTIDDEKLTLEELHRFPNTPVRTPAGLHWDILRLFHEIQSGLAVAGRERKVALDGIGVDTWGVDFGLVGRDGSLVASPVHYRDSRNDGMLERTFAAVPREEIFAHTGIQFMQFNTLCQLYAMKLAGSPALEAAERLLMVPDLLNYWLTGVQANELTDASTTQFYNPIRKGWAGELFERLGLPQRILGEIVYPGTLLGPLVPHVAEAAGMGPVPVYATASHDTAAAVAAVPAEGENWCYISSGTWSLMGLELPEPVVNEDSLAWNLTNEIGYGGSVRLLKNIAGLWLLQECRRAWAVEGVEYSYEELARLAGEAAPFKAVIQPDAFLHPGRLPSRIAEWCRTAGQTPPETPGEFARTILESLALRYRQVLEGLEAVSGRQVKVIHIVGGGSRNAVLNQFVADATRRIVVAGPAEATAAGNVMVQAIGSGRFAGLKEARSVLRRSADLKLIESRPSGAWDDAYARFCGLPAGN
ncbi:MAG: rhamnulokinase [Bryobacterales bacterium]|nr:rhamnulokinase [Bryobacterales bacterium]